jgi:choline dehydrogenase-like flavoprotein
MIIASMALALAVTDLRNCVSSGRRGTMFIDFDSAGDLPLAVDFDVCVVGAGAAGIALATDLAGNGYKVVLLEAGGLSPEYRSQAIYRSEITGHPHDGTSVGRFRTFGGSTTQWGGQILELAQTSFDRRTHVEGSGWPFSKSELASYYDRALEFVGLKGAIREDELVGKILNESNISVGPEFSFLYSRHCFQLNFARHSSLSEVNNLTIIYHANVVALKMNKARSAISAVKVLGYKGRSEEISAKQFIICMGGVESVRLLLQPPSTGILPWQDNGILGRFFQDHILFECIPISELQFQAAARLFGCAEVNGYKYRAHFRLSDAMQSKYSTLDIAAEINPFQRSIKSHERASRMLRDVLKGRRPAIGPVSDLRQLPPAVRSLLIRRTIGEDSLWDRTMLTLHCEQSPRSSSTIALSQKKDSLGMFLAKLHWSISDQELHSLSTFIRLADRVFTRNRIAQLQVPRGFLEDVDELRRNCVDSYHHIGGTRMSASRTDGIVDENLKLFGVSNGYVCSCSVFPSSGFSNPTHTLLSLSFRLSKHICKVLEKISTLSTSLPTAQRQVSSVKHSRGKVGL